MRCRPTTKPHDLIFCQTCFPACTPPLAVSGLAESALGIPMLAPVASRSKKSSPTGIWDVSQTNYALSGRTDRVRTAITTAVVRSRVPAKGWRSSVPAACASMVVHSICRSPATGRHLHYIWMRRVSRSRGPSIGTVRRHARIHCSQLPAGRVVTTVHFGPYGRLADAHTAYSPVVRRAWAPVSGVS